VELFVLGTGDVPVVLAQLVVQDVRGREIGVQRVDDLFGLVGVDADGVLLDGAGLTAK